MNFGVPSRTMCLIALLGGYFVVGAMDSSADHSAHVHEGEKHPSNHSSIIDAVKNDTTDADSASKSEEHDHTAHGSHHMHHDKQPKEAPHAHEESAEIDHDGGNHHSHDDHDHEMMLHDQAVVPGNELDKDGHKDKPDDGHRHENHKDHQHEDMNHEDDHGMDGMGGMGQMGGNGSSMHGMMMWFHTGVQETVLFKEWKITNVAGMIASMVGVLLLAMFYEGLKYFREYLFKQYVSSMQFSTVAVTGESGRVTQIHKVQSHRMLSWAHSLQTCLHIIQIIISYFLMLIFMTYNVWLCLALVIGSGIGYFIFGWKKATVVDITEHCH